MPIGPRATLLASFVLGACRTRTVLLGGSVFRLYGLPFYVVVFRQNHLYDDIFSVRGVIHRGEMDAFNELAHSTRGE